LVVNTSVAVDKSCSCWQLAG